jgi:hypothetical protein
MLSYIDNAPTKSSFTQATGHSDAASSSANQLFTSGISTSSYLHAPHTEVQTPARGTKRRRKPKHVVQNACLNCKRRRTKVSNFNEHRPFKLAGVA